MKKENLKNKKVFVGLSGGVDSSVTAGLLKNAGYDVVGVFIKTWQPDFIECTWRDERRDAMRVAAHLNIPFLTFDAELAYKNGVADYMIEEYKAGRVPNPDVMCNREVKFGVFLKWALANGADFVATGHYAQNINNNLVKGIDEAKDQSYFLWTLTQDNLKHILFPVGNLEKKEVRRLAEKFNLNTATKKDSQGVCFLGPLDMKDFLAHYIKTKSGNVLNENGEIIGNHNGALFFALGERHGFCITKKGTLDKQYYVVAKDLNKNTITVSHEHNPKNISKKEIEITNTNWISGVPQLNKKYTLQIRYHGEFLNCEITEINKEHAKIELDKPQIISEGQSIVIYDKNTCVGGGVLI